MKEYYVINTQPMYDTILGDCIGLEYTYSDGGKDALLFPEQDPVTLLASIYRGLDAGTVTKDFTVEDYFDELGMKEDDRSDFIFFAINEKAKELLKMDGDD